MLPLFVFRGLPVCFFIVLLAAAFANGVRTTWRLQFPDVDVNAPGVDLYRDMGLAQTILDSGYGPDPSYPGERSWYNPLTSAMIAAVSAATGSPVHVVATQIGAYANLLAPVCFFLMCALLFDRWTALYASAGFLFLLSGPLPNWMSATYSPWFMPVNFVQALFYLSLAAFFRAIRTGHLAAFAVVGLLWGLTFLGHTAPALILGGIATIWLAAAVWSAMRGRPQAGVTVQGALQRYVLMIVLALLVSSPLVAVVVGHYGLQVKNAVPGGSASQFVRELPMLIRVHLTLPMAIACLGFFVAFTKRVRLSFRLLLAWGAVAATFLAYGFLRLAGKLLDVALPSIVPSFHFFFYLKAVTAVLFGLGMTAIGRLAASALARRSRSRLADRRGAIAVSKAVPVALCALLLVPERHAFENRPDFSEGRQAALVNSESDWMRVFQWLLAQRRPTDVVLGADRDGSIVIAPSGSKVVYAAAGFSNPYIDLEPRRLARDAMFEALDRDDSAAFRGLADRYGVTHVITHSPRSERYDAHTPEDLGLAFASGPYRVFLVKHGNRVRPSEGPKRLRTVWGD